MRNETPQIIAPRGRKTIALLALLLGTGGCLAAQKPPAQCLTQLDQDSLVAILINPSAINPLGAMAYPLTANHTAQPGDLVRIQNDAGATLKVVAKADPACLQQVPEGDPHAHHRKNITP